MVVKFAIRRVLHSIGVVWGVVTVAFILRYLAPGDVISTIAPEQADAELREQIAADLGLNEPIYIQYGEYLINIVTGNLGYSYVNQVSVNELILNRIAPTLELAVTATIIAVGIALPLGVISAVKKNKTPDYLATIGSLLGVSTPNFWLGIILILVISVNLGWLPTSGRSVGFIEAVVFFMETGSLYGIVEWLRYIILPAITLGTFFTALVTRMVRSEMLEEMGNEYVEVLEAKGIPKSLAIYKHVLRNSMMPVVTVIGLQMGYLLSGAVVTETVFQWPGLGTLLITAVESRDWPLIQGILIVIALLWVIINTTADVTYKIIDPRVGFE